MSMPSPFEMGRAVGGNVSGGIRGGLEQGAIGKILQEAQQIQDPNQIDNIMNQVLPRLSEENRPMVAQALGNIKQKKSSALGDEFLTSEGINPNIKYLEKGMGEIFLKERAAASAALLKEEKDNRMMLKKAQIESEFKSPEIIDYKKGLGARITTATSIYPALQNARKYEGDMSRFIPGSAASKALGDLATRAFGFYKPLFGGKLTQAEFKNSIQNIAADKTTPGGYNQALNIIESMYKQAEMEDDFFAKNIESGMTPAKAMRETRKQMKDGASEIVSILQQGGKKEQQQRQQPMQAQKTQQFILNGEEYNVPFERVEAFKAAKGIK